MIDQNQQSFLDNQYIKTESDESESQKQQRENAQTNLTEIKSIDSSSYTDQYSDRNQS